MKQKESVTLVVCDGLGLSPEMTGNAVLNAATPTLDYLLSNYPSLSLLAAGTEVGLDPGEPGNSEVGHLTIGTGQVLPQAFQIINGAIKSGTYKNNKTFLNVFNHAKKNNTTVHVIGLVSKGGVHGHLDHMVALLQLAHEQNVPSVVVHAITDGRDTPSRVALEDITALESVLSQFPAGHFGSVSGRFYAMDRDSNWERSDGAYWAIHGRGAEQSHDIRSAITAAYNRGEGDETLQPTTILDEDGESSYSVKAGDIVIFTNYRPDRIRQLATRLLSSTLALQLVTFTDYFLDDVPHLGNEASRLHNAYPLPKPKGTLAQALSHANRTQLHIAETEKYAHITYFFNGHQEKKLGQEDWLLIPSPKIDAFDRQPEMSAAAVTAAYKNAIAHHPADFTAVNFANADMVGHTGNYNATLQAVTSVDSQLKSIVSEVESRGDWLLITADHGNAEQMRDSITGESNKEHTTNPVPLLIIHPSLKASRPTTKQQLSLLSNVGMLADVAPTILDIMGVSIPAEMVGSSLLPQVRLT